MITVRKAQDRFHTDLGWLDSHHTFSFGDHYDEEHMGFRDLRVINEDRVAAGQGFHPHQHRDMEILSFVLEGAIAHKDSLGTGSTIRAGEIQRMSAGTGVVHSEFNASKDAEVHFLQIWILPERKGIAPGYEQKTIAPPTPADGPLRIIASPEPKNGGVKLHQDVVLYAGRFDAGSEARFELRPGRHAWVQVTRGELTVNGTAMQAGDGAAVSEETALALKSSGAAEILLFDLN